LAFDQASVKQVSDRTVTLVVRDACGGGDVGLTVPAWMSLQVLDDSMSGPGSVVSAWFRGFEVMTLVDWGGIESE